MALYPLRERGRGTVSSRTRSARMGQPCRQTRIEIRHTEIETVPAEEECAIHRGTGSGKEAAEGKLNWQGRINSLRYRSDLLPPECV